MHRPNNSQQKSSHCCYNDQCLDKLTSVEIATSIKYLSRVDPIKFSSLKPTFIDSIQENKQIEAKKLAKLKVTGPSLDVNGPLTNEGPTIFNSAKPLAKLKEKNTALGLSLQKKTSILNIKKNTFTKLSKAV